MTSLERLNVTSRAFGIAAVLGLSLALFNLSMVRVMLLLTAISAISIALQLRSSVPTIAIAMFEGGLSALVVGVALPDGVALLPYLVVPSLIVGVTAGARLVAALVGIESVALLLVVLTGARTDAWTQASLLLPWLVTSLGVGLLSAWLRDLRLVPSAVGADPSYESARRLLSQLRVVARRLSSGLDSVSLATDMLITAAQHLGDGQSAVFVRTDGGVLSPLSYWHARSREALLPSAEMVEHCWLTMEPVHSPQAVGEADRRHRTLLPLRVGGRVIGVVVIDSGRPPVQRALHDVMSRLDEASVRLDAALLFDEVRSLATMEERQRLAREIHDGVAQEIASLGYAVDDLVATATSEATLRRLHGLRAELSRIVSELRLSIFDLRSEISAGLGSALSEYVREVGARSGLTVHLTLNESPTRLRPEIESELLRISQEAVTNARKHAEAEHLWVDCRIHAPAVRISIRDDGRGLRPGRVDSYGLTIMRERADRINATLEVRDAQVAGFEHGTEVVIELGNASALRGRVSSARRTVS